MKVVVAGRGKVGRGLARALRRTGIRTRLVRGRTVGRSEVKDADLVVLAVPDDAIASCAHRIAPHLRRQTAVVHCAGARGLDPLDACRAAGAATAVMHPMASFADIRRPPVLAGVTFVVQGDAAAVKAVRALAREVGARVVVAPVHGPAYHAAAVLVANATAAMADAGVRLLEHLDVPRKGALQAVAGLLRTVADNVERVGTPAALTGPVARGDAVTVRAHRAALGQVDRRVLDAYDRVTPAIVETAVSAGLSPARARTIKRALSSEGKKRKKRP